MSLFDDIVLHYKGESYPPEGSELDLELVDNKWVPKDTVTELVSEEDLDQARWGTWFANVYKRGDEYVQVKDCRPATENQDWGDYGPPEIKLVEPHTKTVTTTYYKEI